jgi:epoxide hydrolase-like predicted phosphatase
MEPQIKTFIFDCFGVICANVMGGWYKENSLRHGFVDENLPDVFRKFDLNLMSEDDVHEHFLRYEGIVVSKEKLREDIDAYLKIDENLVEIIKKLRAQGFKTALLSNGNHSFFERKIYTTYPEFKELFDEIIISSLVGMVKPNDDIFLHALEKTKSKPEEAVFIDDTEVNVDAAIKLGIHGFLYTDSASFAAYLQSLGIN